MTPRFEKLDLVEFRQRLDAYNFGRQIDAVHLHHTFRPDHGTFAGEKSIVGMWRYHTETNGWSDIAQHVTIDPTGGIWTGRDWNRPPASAKDQNGTFARGPFMLELVGNFDEGRDRFDGAQKEAAIAVIAAIQDHFGLTPDSLRFHNEFSAKTCPGETVEKWRVLAEVGALRSARAKAAAGARSGGGTRSGRGTPSYVATETGCGEGGEEAMTPTRSTGARTSNGGEPVRRAVCVGINAYRSEKPLSGCVADAEAWARLLSGAGFEVQLLRDEEAIWSAVLSALGAMVQDAVPGSSIVFQFAGHGTLLPDESGDEPGRADPTPFDDESLVPYDSATGAYVTDDDLAGVFGGLQSGVVATLLIDACNSGGIRHLGAGRLTRAPGAVVRGIRATDRMIGAHRAFRSTLPNGGAAYGTGTSPAVVFSACQSFEAAFEENGRGVFSRVATAVLSNRPDATNEQLLTGILDALGGERKQTPVLDCPAAARGAQVFRPFGL